MISGSGRSPGEGRGNPLQYSCLGNVMVRGAWWAAVHGTESDMTEQLRTHSSEYQRYQIRVSLSKMGLMLND